MEKSWNFCNKWLILQVYSHNSTLSEALISQKLDKTTSVILGNHIIPSKKINFKLLDSEDEETSDLESVGSAGIDEYLFSDSSSIDSYSSNNLGNFFEQLYKKKLI